MSTVRLIARLVLIVVFTASAVGKLLDRAGARAGVTAFGLPPRLVRPVAVARPLAELAVVGLLVWGATVWWGGLGALVLLALFSAGIAARLGRGEMPDCHCFGQLRSRPMSARMLVRNGLFAVPAVLLVLTA